MPKASFEKLEEVQLLRSPDGRLWRSQAEYEKTLTQEMLEHEIQPLAKRFKELCERAVELKCQGKIPEDLSRAFVVFLRQNKDIIKVFME